jgi:hypothetical protein
MNANSSLSANGANGRNGSGRFAKGNPGGPGNPHARRVSELRSVLLGKISDQDLAQIVDTLLAKAKGGDLLAIREVLDRTLGKPTLQIEANVCAEDTKEPATMDRMALSLANLHVPLETWPIMPRVGYERTRDGSPRPDGFQELHRLVEQNCVGWTRTSVPPRSHVER